MDKEALERWKLELEIANLRKPWYKNLEMWKVIIPAVAIVLSLIYTFSSGWINIEKSKLELKKEKLNKEIDQFSQKSDSISKVLMLKDSLVDVSQLFIDSLEKSRDELISMVNLLKFKDNLTAAQIDSINNLLINERRGLSKKVKSLEAQLDQEKNEIDLSDSDVLIGDISDFYAPNTFTPDNDGINDLFLPIILDKENIKSYSLKIFDRTGTIIFRTNNVDQWWNGKVRDQTDFAESDVYHWMIAIEGKGLGVQKIYLGHVTLIR
jgi:gliding motility-associated-like protein